MGQYSYINQMGYKPFDSETCSVFSLHDYSWAEHGFALVNRFYQNFAPVLDAEFQAILNLTYQSYQDMKDVDTSPLRMAVWYYVLRLYGLYHADYSYEKVHIFLTHPIKVFIEKIACDPETMNIHDFRRLRSHKLNYSERCHIALLAFEAHRQASLLYGLKALMDYMNKPSL